MHRWVAVIQNQLAAARSHAWQSATGSSNASRVVNAAVAASTAARPISSQHTACFSSSPFGGGKFGGSIRGATPAGGTAGKAATGAAAATAPPRPAPAAVPFSDVEFEQIVKWSDQQSSVTAAEMETVLAWQQRSVQLRSHLERLLLLRIIAQFDHWRPVMSMQLNSDSSVAPIERGYYNFHPRGSTGAKGLGFYSGSEIHPKIAAGTKSEQFVTALGKHTVSGIDIFRELLAPSESKAHPNTPQPPSAFGFSPPGFDVAYFNVGDEAQHMWLSAEQDLAILRMVAQTIAVRRALRSNSLDEMVNKLLPRWFGIYSPRQTWEGLPIGQFVSGIGVRPTHWYTLRHPEGGPNSVLLFPSQTAAGGRLVMPLFDCLDGVMQVLRAVGVQTKFDTALTDATVQLASENVAAVVQHLNCDICIVTGVQQQRSSTTATLPFDGTHIAHEQMLQAGKKPSDALWEEPAKQGPVKSQ